MFGFGGRKRYEEKVSVLLRDLDKNGHISPYAASSKTANQFRLSGCTEHETALGLCLSQVDALHKSGRLDDAEDLISTVFDYAELWTNARVARLDLLQEWFKDCYKRWESRF